MNITIYNSAKEQLNNLLENSDDKYIRIYTRSVTMYDEAKIDLKIDDMKEDDELFEVDNYKIVINKRFAMQISTVSISYGGLLSRDSFSVDTDFGFFDMQY